LPDCLNSETSEYEKGRIFRTPDFSLVENTGWQLTKCKEGDVCYCAEKPGAALAFNLTGKRLWLGFRQYAGDYGRVQVCVDSGEPITLEGYFARFAGNDAWRGGHLIYEEISRDTHARQHNVRVKLLEEHHSKSNGTHFEIAYALLIG
jgi:hypothetical protein